MTLQTLLSLTVWPLPWSSLPWIPLYWKKVKVLVAQSCPTLCDPMDCSPPGSSVHGLLQARTLEWVAISLFRASSWPGDRTQVSCIAGRFCFVWASREAHAPLLPHLIISSMSGSPILLSLLRFFIQFPCFFFFFFFYRFVSLTLISVLNPRRVFLSANSRYTR